MFKVEKTTFWKFISITYIWSEHVSCNSGSQLKQENETEEHWEGDGHAVVLFDGAAAAEEGDKEDDAAHHDQQDWGIEKLKWKKSL